MDAMASEIYDSVYSSRSKSHYSPIPQRRNTSLDILDVYGLDYGLARPYEYRRTASRWGPFDDLWETCDQLANRLESIAAAPHTSIPRPAVATNVRLRVCVTCVKFDVIFLCRVVGCRNPRATTAQQSFLMLTLHAKWYGTSG